jgi:hypothetical protein
MTDADTMIEGAVQARDRLPTVPYDLRELARAAIGPSASDEVARRVASLVEVHDDSLAARTAAFLADISPVDVPRLAMAADCAALLVDHREAFVLACLDGASTLTDVLEVVGLPTGDVLEIVCSLCARGILALDRAMRAA